MHVSGPRGSEEKRKLILPAWRTERSEGRATEGARWMPWHQEPKKDVDGCEKPRGVASRL